MDQHKPINDYEVLISKILNGTSEEKKNNEQIIKNLETECLDQLLIDLTLLLQGKAEDDIKRYAIDKIESILYQETDSIGEVWPKIQSKSQQEFKNQLLVSLENNLTTKNRRPLCKVISELAGQFFSLASMNGTTSEAQEETKEDDGEWKELNVLVYNWMYSKNVEQIECSLLLLKILIVYDVTTFTFKELHKFILQQLSSNNSVNTTHCVDIIVNCLIDYENDEAQSVFKDIIPDLLQALKNNYENDKEQLDEALEGLTDLISNNLKLFKAYYKDIFAYLKSVVESEQDKNVQKQAAEGLVTLIENRLNIVKNMKQEKVQIFEIILKFMIDNFQDPDEEWNNPKSDVKVEDEAILFGIDMINRLIETLGESDALPIISKIVGGLIGNKNNWKQQAVALICYSQVGGYIAEPLNLAPIIGQVTSQLQNTHPKVRYCAIHALGQISEDVKEEFCLMYAKDVLPAFIEGFNDSNPRVFAHTLASASNFVENANAEILGDDLEMILQICIKSIQNKSSVLVTQNALSLITALADRCSDSIDDDQLVDIAKQIMETAGNSKQLDDSPLLQGVLCDSLVSISHAIDEVNFALISDQVLQIVSLIQKKVENSHDSRVAYILSCWEKIPELYEEEEILEILPSTWDMVLKVLKELSTRYNNLLYSDQDDDDLDINEEEENADITKKAKQILSQQKETNTKSQLFSKIKVGLGCIQKIFDSYSSTQLHQAEAVFEVLQSLYTSTLDAELLIECMKAGDALLEALKIDSETSKESQKSLQLIGSTLTKDFTNKLVKCYSHLENVQFIESLGDMIKSGGRYMQKQLVDDVCLRFINILTQMQFDDLDGDDGDFGDDDDGDFEGGEDDDELKEELEEMKKIESNLQIQIALLIGDVIKSHTDLTVDSAKQIFNVLLPTALEHSNNDNQHKMGLFLVCDFIEHIGYDHLKDEWDALAMHLLNNITNKNSEVRQAAAFGLGMFSQYTPTKAFEPYNMKILNALADVMEIPKSKSKNDDAFGHARDNSVASIGKMLRYQSEILGNPNKIAHIWLTQLPLKDDTQENVGQYNILLDILESQTSILLQNDQDGENVFKLLNIMVSEGRNNSRVHKIVSNLAESEKYGKAIKQILSEVKNIDKLIELLKNKE